MSSTRPRAATAPPSSKVSSPLEMRVTAASISALAGPVSTRGAASLWMSAVRLAMPLEVQRHGVAQAAAQPQHVEDAHQGCTLATGRDVARAEV